MLDYRYLAGMDGMYNNMLQPTAANQIGMIDPGMGMTGFDPTRSMRPDAAFPMGGAPAMAQSGMTNPGGAVSGPVSVTGTPPSSGFIPADPGAVAPYSPAMGQSGFVDQTQQDAYGRFTTSPDYLFRFNEGQRMLDSSAAARGMLMSGNQLRALTELGQNLASGEYGNYMNRLYGVAGLAPSGGQALAAQGGAQGFNQMFNAAGSLGTNLGNIAGANANAQAGIWGSALGNIDFGSLAQGIGNAWNSRPISVPATVRTGPNMPIPSGVSF